MTVEFCDDSTLVASSRHITVGGVDVTSSFTYATGSRTGCRAFATASGSVTLSLGGQQIVARIDDGRANRGTKTKSVTLNDGYVTADVGFNVNDNQRPDLCELSCFAATYAASTIPYFSLGAPRNVTVVYSSDRRFPRPFVYLDITRFTDDAPIPSRFLLQVKVDGAYRNFTNSANGAENEGTLVFGGRREVVRLGGQIDASDLATGIHQMQVVLTTVLPDSSQQVKTMNTKLLVVNESGSAVAAGWSIAGLQRVIGGDSGSVVITDGSGGAAYFRPFGAARYYSPWGDVSVVDSIAGGWIRSYPDSTRIRFDAAGRMTSVTDRLGNTVNYGYDGSGRLTRIEDPYRTVNGSAVRAAITLSYGANGLHRIVDPGPAGDGVGGRATTFVVDASRRVTSIQDPDGLSTQFGYDAAGRLETVTDRRSGVTRFVYDAATWKLSSLQLPQVEVIEAGTAVQRTPTVTYRPWQSVGVPTSSTTNSAFVPLHPDSTIARVTDPIGRISSFAVTRWGQPTRMVDPLGRTTTIAYSGLFVDRITTPDGAVADYNFNSSGQLASFQEPGQERIYIRYGAAGQPDSIYFTGRMIQRRVLDAATGRIDAVGVPGTDSLTRFTYDAVGRVTSQRDWRNHETKYRYESRFGNVDSVGTDNGSYALTSYDDFGRVSGARARTTQGMLPWTTIEYDALNRTTEVHDGVHASPTTYEYDALYLTKVRDPKGQVYRVALNALGWATHQYDPSDTTSWTRFIKLGYDAAGRRVAMTNRRGQTVNYTYDAIDRLTGKSGTNLEAATYSYSADGRISVSANALSVDSVFRAATQWTDSVVTWVHGERFRLLYKASKYRDLDSIGIATTSPITFAARRYYQASGLLDSVRVGSQVVKFGYNDHLQRDTTTWPGAIRRVESYLSTHQLGRSSFTSSSLDGAFWRNYLYGLDGRMSQEDRRNGAGYKIRTFNYDSIGQLRRATVSTTSQTVTCPDPSGTELVYNGSDCTTGTSRSYTQDETYGYDAAGNLTSEQDVAASTSATATYAAANRLLTWGAASYEHDLDGNRTRKLAGGVDTRYGWDAEGRLTSVTVGTRVVTYHYNAVGQLVHRKIGGLKDRYFLWDRDLLLAELNATATARIAEYAYLPGIDRPLALVTGATALGATRFYAQDAGGSVTGVFSGSTVTQKLEYDARGVLVAVTGTLADTSRLRWKGLLYEGDSTKLYYMRNRWYDPESGRFMTEDPLHILGGLNLYVFAENDPIGKSDPFGLLDCPAGQRPARWVNIHTGEIIAEWCEEIQTSGGGPYSGPSGGSTGNTGSRGPSGPIGSPTGDSGSGGGHGDRGRKSSAAWDLAQCVLPGMMTEMGQQALTGLAIGFRGSLSPAHARGMAWGIRNAAGQGAISEGLLAIPAFVEGYIIGAGGTMLYYSALGMVGGAGAGALEGFAFGVRDCTKTELGAGTVSGR